MALLDLPRRILMEHGAINRLDELVSENSGTRVLVILDSFLANAPVNLHLKISEILLKRGFESSFFSNFSGEPTTKNVEDAIKQLKEFQGDIVIAIGGGSAIDLGKATAVFGKNEDIDWHEISGCQRLERLPLLAVPTTSGTGSEVTKIMVITNLETNVKMNPGHPNLIPDIAILDPELTLSLPPHFTVYTGLDALTHAIEGYVSNRATTMTDHFALEAIQKIGGALSNVYKNGKDKESRKEMMLASCYAGIAFSNASTNLAHAAGRPLGAQFHMPHGLSVALLLPFVMKFGLESSIERFAEIAIALGEDPQMDTNKLAERSIEIIEEYNSQFEIWTDAQKYIEPQQLIDRIPTLVEDAISGNGIATNRKVPTENDIKNVYNMLAERIALASKKKIVNN